MRIRFKNLNHPLARSLSTTFGFPSGACLTLNSGTAVVSDEIGKEAVATGMFEVYSDADLDEVVAPPTPKKAPVLIVPDPVEEDEAPAVVEEPMIVRKKPLAEESADEGVVLTPITDFPEPSKTLSKPKLDLGKKNKRRGR